ncbi:MAG TPA: amidohydrolase family protein [Bryobacteraceae bacterium]|nr:amidohydrolase family protein [Bryobacteraceae bacterium]
MTKLFIAGLIALAPLSQVMTAQVTVIKNATIMTESSKGTIKGSIVVRDGKIAEVGENVMVPAGATVIDAAGQWVTPGIIDCHSHIAGDGNINEGSVSVSSMVNIKDIINPEDIAIYRALAGGITTANILHGSANSIGGQTIVLKMRWGKDADGMIFEGAKPGIKFALGENPKRAGNPQGGRGAPAVNARYPATRMGVEDTIREAFNEAVQYKAEWDAYERAVAGGQHPIPPRKDLKLEALKEVLEGKRFVHAHCYRSDEILMLIRVADDYGFKIRTFQHVLEGYKVAKEIAAHGAGASTFSDWWGYKMEAIDAIPYNAAIMTKKGVVVSLNSDDAELMRRLNTEAAKAMKYGGISREDALAMVTINPAKQLGVENRVGSIEAGKDADIVIFDKDPLSPVAKVQRVMIDGNKYFDRDNEVSGRPMKEAEKQKLIEQEKQDQQNAQKKGAPTRRPQQ